MNDQILKGYLRDFQIKQGFEKLDDTDVFSHFVTFCIVSRQIGIETPLEDLDVDGYQDTGLDAVAILVNNKIITEKGSIDYFKETGRMDVEFIFIQSKTSPRFEADKIGTFLFGIQNFFQSGSAIPASAEILHLKEIKDYIYQNSIALRRAPVCRAFYASTGKWTNDEHLEGRVASHIKQLNATGLFSDVHFYPVDADKIKSYYRELRHSVEKEVVFEKHTILPKIDGVQEAYIGILPSSEFIKLVTDDAGEIQNGLFYDNVRDFQGSTPVNTEIQSTLTQPTRSESFVLLNNGITIVAKSINKIGASFRITDYQIVNGCQTSHVIQQNAKTLGPNVCVPIKLIVTSDPDLTNEIIKASNRQTEVKLEAFESLRPFHRTLEEFYNSFSKDPSKSLFYERRSKQYERSSIHPVSIITLAAQSMSFLAMFLNEPHSTPRYYGEILETNRDRLFSESHSPFPYYTSGLALSRVEALFRNRELPMEWKRFKYHLLLLLRLSFDAKEHFPLEGKAAEEKSRLICELLWDKNKTKDAFLSVGQQLTEKLRTFADGKAEANRRRAFTLELLPSRKQRRPRGTVKFWDQQRQFGFITAEDNTNVFVHWRSIRETVHTYLRIGETVEFDLTKTDKGFEARNVIIIPKGK